MADLYCDVPHDVISSKKTILLEAGIKPDIASCYTLMQFDGVIKCNKD